MNPQQAPKISETSTDLAQLAAHIQRLPMELQNQIEDMVYKMALRGGFLYPPAAAMHDAEPQRLPSPNTALLTVDKHVHAKYAKYVWTENTFVIGAVKPSYLAKLTANTELCKSIHKVRLSLSTHDLGYGFECQMEEAVHKPARQAAGLQGYYLRMVWSVKVYFVGLLAGSLEELTLDFTDCYGAMPRRFRVDSYGLQWWIGEEVLEDWHDRDLVVPLARVPVIKVLVPESEGPQEQLILDMIRDPKGTHRAIWNPRPFVLSPPLLEDDYRRWSREYASRMSIVGAWINRR